MGKGTVNYTNTLPLSNVLHAPSFPVNLLSISAIISQLNCVVLFDKPKVIFREKGTGKVLGTGTLHKGLWYVDEENMEAALALVLETNNVWEGNEGKLLMLYHRRLGHPAFPILEKMYPEVYRKVDTEGLVCDACELGKHTRGSYASSGGRSSCSFELIHSDVWGPCPTTALNGFRYFVTFIDCFSRVTWLYLMKNKSDVFSCF